MIADRCRLVRRQHFSDSNCPAAARRSEAAVRTPCRVARAGFTLIELMLVLALVVAIGGIVYPALRRPLANHRLQSAAKELRAELARLRLTAIESGEAQQYRYVPGEGRYRFGADRWLPPSAMGQQDTETGPRITAGGGAIKRANVPAQQPLPRWEETELPEGVTFATPEMDTRLQVQQAATPSDELESSLGDEPSDQLWAPPIVFQPDGTSTDATITLANESEMQITISLRGLTGLASLGEVEAREDEPQAIDEAQLP